MSQAENPSDPTFRSYKPDQAASYAKYRTGYATAIYDFVLDHHKATGGQTGTLLDVGSGPGQVTRGLAPAFDAAVGVDPGAEMISTAKEIGGITASGEPIRYYVCSAEQLDGLEDVPKGSVDLITAGMAAHWFDMAKFWAGASKLLKPGGTIALWTHASFYCHPSTPNAKEVQSILSEMEDVTLVPHVLPPNKLSRDLYADLVLPWALPETATIYDKDSFFRREWDVNGQLSDGREFLSGSQEHSLEDIEGGFSTASMVTRWREAHPDLAGTEKDCVRSTMERVRIAMGVEKGKEAETTIKTGCGTVVLCVKRK